MVENGQEKKEIPRRKRVHILIPAYNNMSVTFVGHLIKLMSYTMQKYDVEVTIQEDCPVDKARNTLAESAIEKNADYCLWLDTDNIIPLQGLDMLIEVLDDPKYKADMVSGLYFEKKKPYFPVIREFHSDGFWKIENPPLGKVFEIAGCGMGTVVMRPEVFRKLKYPYFCFNYEMWGYKGIQLSEDLYFCRQVLNAGMKIYCHSGVISGHLGSGVDAFEYMSMAPIRQEAIDDRDELFKDMVEFSKETEEETHKRIMVGAERMMEEWNKVNPKTPEEKKKFYRETENYLYDLFNWHFTKRRQFDVELVTGLASMQKKAGRPLKVLDFGCGIGQNALMLARAGMEVTLAELESYTLDFAEHRFKAHKVPYKVWKTDKEDLPPEEKYDVILAFDVFEHMEFEERKAYIEKLIKLKARDCKVLYNVSFGTQGGLHPMHDSSRDEDPALIQRLIKEPTE